MLAILFQGRTLNRNIHVNWTKGDFGSDQGHKIGKGTRGLTGLTTPTKF